MALGILCEIPPCLRQVRQNAPVKQAGIGLLPPSPPRGRSCFAPGCLCAILRPRGTRAPAVPAKRSCALLCRRGPAAQHPPQKRVHGIDIFRVLWYGNINRGRLLRRFALGVNHRDGTFGAGHCVPCRARSSFSYIERVCLQYALPIRNSLDGDILIPNLLFKNKGFFGLLCLFRQTDTRGQGQQEFQESGQCHLP